MPSFNRRSFIAAAGASLLPQTSRAEVYDLTSLQPHRVTATTVEYKGRKALKVELAEEVRRGKPGIDYGDTDSFMIVPTSFRTGTIEVDLLGKLRADAPPDMRAFIGLAYHIAAEGKHFEAAYVRPLNGLKLNPPPPRNKRAVQYFAYPDWRFDRLREAYPDGRYEAGANIAGDEWITLRLEVAADRMTVKVNGVESLIVREPKMPLANGAIGLWIDIGTEGYFSNLRIAPG
ncbi:MAG TPA: hypothetical protein VMI56_19110 [Reyranella sp.]|nr:hypothetical protein [Reyranella sp.]